MSYSNWARMALVAGWMVACVAGVSAQRPAANFQQANKYTDAFLRQFTYSTSVAPQWIGKTDNFWYEYRTSKGRQWYKVQPSLPSKEPLFDRAHVAAALSEEVRKPLDPLQLPITRGSLSEDGVKFKFVAEDLQFEYDLVAKKLAKLGKAPRTPGTLGTMSPEQQQRMKEVLGEERFRQIMEQQRGNQGDKDKKEESFFDDVLSEDERAALEDELRLPLTALRWNDPDEEPQQKKGGGGGFKGGFPKGSFGNDYKNTSPDKKHYAFLKNYNLYVAEAGKEDQAIQLTKDGQEDYTFAGFGGFGGQFRDEKDKDEKDKDDKDKEKDDKDATKSDQDKDIKKDDVKDKDKKTRAPVTWSKDSKSFYVTRRDSRKVKELYLVNAVAEPRPSLMKYPYPMPGDEHIRKSELFVFHLEKKELVRVERKWKDESYSDLHWGKTSDDLRFLRGDRLHRNIEFCSYNPTSKQAKCLILEGFENSSLAPKPMRYLDESDEMIWWSERTGWGHFYLYDRDGKLKNAITSGNFRASSIVAYDAKHRTLYVQGNSREPGENVYQNHLYSVRLDGTGLTLLDPGDADHDSKLSPTKQYLVDNYSRVDQVPMSVLRDGRGNKVLDLEKADLSKLEEVGWQMPETFTVKAADGVTDLYGNLYKPYDFDARKKYPIIAHVYPGPQTESMPHSFKVYSSQQQLAQLGFIVVQVGNRGGTPLRSKAYQSHSYWNLRDYGLSDKKFALEQLAAKLPWMDIERVGIYGHSGGGFMSAAALLVKPYNEFFKVAVASAGNHDNNIYNNSWAERYHGMKEVPIAKDETKTEAKSTFRGRKMPPTDDQDEVKTKTDEKKDTTAKKDDAKEIKEAEKDKPGTKFEIKVPTNAELASNLRGKLLLVHGDMDNNVHPANTIRLVDALIKANKRFDMLIMPGKAHGFGTYQPYFTQRMWDYFVEHLLDERPTGTDLFDRREKN